MRDIKFRAWIKPKNPAETDHMVHPLVFQLIHDGSVDRLFTNDQKYKDDMYDFTLMQYTGLKDKNGVEIYEGDIVTEEAYNMPMTIVWSDDQKEWLGMGAGWMIEDQETYKNYTDNMKSDDEYTVIGNIYENKELLNE